MIDLRDFAFFHGFSAEDLEPLAEAAGAASFDADRFIFREGDPRRVFALIVSGSVASAIGADGRPVRLPTVGAGDGRSGGLAPGVEQLRALRRRVHRLVWITPEPQRYWYQATCAMPQTTTG